MSQQPYQDPIMKKYVDLIIEKTGQTYKAFYYGEPTRIGASVLPCIIVSKSETRAGQITNAEDEHAVGLNFIVVTDIRSDLSTEGNDAKIVEGVNSLYDLVEGRNDDFSLKDECLLNILRSNQAVDVSNNLRTDLGQVTRVSYGETFQNRDQSEWRVEARIEVIAQFIQVR